MMSINKSIDDYKLFINKIINNTNVYQGFGVWQFGSRMHSVRWKN